MTRKDYELIARVLASFKDEENHHFFVNEFIVALSRQNSNFDADKFKAACYRSAE